MFSYEHEKTHPIDPVKGAIMGEYDFSKERLQDTVGIKPPKLVD